MRNPLTFQVESYMGAAFVTLFAGFCVAMIFIALQNFDSETRVLVAQEVYFKSISPSQRVQMELWLRQNNVRIPEGEGYRWLIYTYPSRPWEQD